MFRWRCNTLQSNIVRLQLLYVEARQPTRGGAGAGLVLPLVLSPLDTVIAADFAFLLEPLPEEVLDFAAAMSG